MWSCYVSLHLSAAKIGALSTMSTDCSFWNLPGCWLESQLHHFSAGATLKSHFTSLCLFSSCGKWGSNAYIRVVERIKLGTGSEQGLVHSKCYKGSSYYLFLLSICYVPIWKWQ